MEKPVFNAVVGGPSEHQKNLLCGGFSNSTSLAKVFMPAKENSDPGLPTGGQGDRDPAEVTTWDARGLSFLFAAT